MTQEPQIFDYPFKTHPYDHQLKIWLESRAAHYFALLMEMGTGKTKVAIDTCGWLFGRGEINGLVVVAPKSICRNWADKEIPAHLPDSIERRVVLWGGKSKKKMEQDLATLREVEPMKFHVLVVNIEAIGTDRCYDAVESFLKGHHAMMIIDESTTIKNHKALRAKAVINLSRYTRYRRILTGTPVTQSPLDLFSQFEFLSHGALGSYSWFGFRNQYAVLRKRYVNGRSFDEIVGYQRLEELHKILKPISYRVLKKDCLDLPPKIYEVRHVEMTEAQTAYYEQMREEAMSILSSGDVIAAPLVLTQLLRLRQCLCNIAPRLSEDDLDKSFQNIDKKDPRAEEVLALLQEAGEQKVIIWANFIPSIRNLVTKIAEEYGVESVGAIMGSVSAAARQELVTKFQDPDSPCRFIVAQPRTGGFGLTLTAATLVIYHDNDWSLETRLQSEDRAHRIGQHHPVTYIDIVAANTIDEKIRDALMEKKVLADLVTSGAPQADSVARQLEEKDRLHAATLLAMLK